MATIPLLVAHRGEASRYPENSLSAFRGAAEAGADAVELDLQRAACGTPMVIHDPELQRTTGLDGRVEDYSAQRLTGFSVHEPGRFGDRFLGEPLPTLRQAAEMLAQLPFRHVFLELKEEALAGVHVATLVDRVLEDSQVLGDGRRALISFSADAVEETRRRGVPAGWVLPALDDSRLRLATELAPEFLFCDRGHLPPTDTALPTGSWQWAVYEVTDAREARALHGRGVTLIETMYPRELREALAAGG